MSGELEPSVEFESGNSTDRISVQGRLKSHAKFWLDELDPSYSRTAVAIPNN